MAQLRFTAVHEDGQHLVLSAEDGTELLLPIDERLRAAVRTRGPVPDTPPSQLRPRDVQAMIRAGQTAEEVATVTGWPVDRVVRFEAPIVAERGHVAGLARAAHVRGRDEGVVPTLESRVHGRLAARGVDTEATTWDATRPEGGSWTVLVSFVAGQRQRSAAWRFDPTARTVEALDDEARWLSEDEQALPGSAAGKELLGSHGASGEVDLVTSLRERSRTRGRRRRTTASPETDEPVVQPADEDVLPLENLASAHEPGSQDSPDADPTEDDPTADDPTAGATAEDNATAEADTPKADAAEGDTPDAATGTPARSRRRRGKAKGAAKDGAGPATEGKASPAATSEQAAPEGLPADTSYHVELDFDEDYEVDPTPQDATLADLFGPGDDAGYPGLLDDDLDTSGFDGADEALPSDTTPGDDLQPAPSGEEPQDSGPTESEPAESQPAETDSNTASDVEPESTTPDSTKASDSEPDSSTDTDSNVTADAGSDATDAESTPAVSPERPTRRKDGRPGVPSWDDIMFGAKDRK